MAPADLVGAAVGYTTVAGIPALIVAFAGWALQGLIRGTLQSARVVDERLADIRAELERTRLDRDAYKEAAELERMNRELLTRAPHEPEAFS